MKNFLKFAGFLALFIIVLVYCVKNIYSFKEAKKQYSKLHPEYVFLLKQKQTLSLEVKSLRVKVQGIREKTLNNNILEERIKVMLNYKLPMEIVVTN